MRPTAQSAGCGRAVPAKSGRGRFTRPAPLTIFIMQADHRSPHSGIVRMVRDGNRCARKRSSGTARPDQGSRRREMFSVVIPRRHRPMAHHPADRFAEGRHRPEHDVILADAGAARGGTRHPARGRHHDAVERPLHPAPCSMFGRLCPKERLEISAGGVVHNPTGTGIYYKDARDKHVRLCR